MRAIEARGGLEPGSIRVVEVAEPTPAPGEALVRVIAAGVNFLDVRLRREGRQTTLGYEGAGEVVAVGDGDASGLRPGLRVAWAMHPGAYAELAVVPTRLLVPLPDAISCGLAAATMLQGLTGDYLTQDSWPVRPGADVLVHAAAGGVGTVLTQLCSAAGARVIGTVSSDAKAATARAAGVETVIRYEREDFAAAARRATDGAGVHCVYDGVNRTTFRGSLRALRRRGTLVLYGQASGRADPIAPEELRRHGSVNLTYPALEHFIEQREELLARSGRVFAALADGTLRPSVTEYALADVGEAHARLHARRTTGKIVLRI